MLFAGAKDKIIEGRSTGTRHCGSPFREFCELDMFPRQHLLRIIRYGTNSLICQVEFGLKVARTFERIQPPEIIIIWLREIMSAKGTNADRPVPSAHVL
jgi:hypothetical protein